MTTYTVLIEQDEDGLYVASVPSLQGCATQGRTIEEVLSRIREAIQACLEADNESVEPAKFIGVQQIEV